MNGRILVVGGTGAFGRRLAEGILATTTATVVIGTRRPGHGSPIVDDLRQRYGQHRIETVRIDRDRPPDFLHALRLSCVVDAAGPFQGREPALARAAAAAGCHYIDLADARDFVGRFGALDGLTRRAGIVAATGASSTPALSGAVTRSLVAGWRSVEAIEIAISPGNRAPRGLSVTAAILSYAGQPLRVWREGAWTQRPGWGDLVRRTLPGLGSRWLSLCETPDLDLLPARHPEVRSVLFRAGLELPLLHVGLWCLSLLVRCGLLRSLRPLAPALRQVASWFEGLGTDRGGMSVDIRGRDQDDRRIRTVWTLIAEAGDGPNVPVLPALALLRKLLRGDLPEPGAFMAGDLLSLADIEQEFARFRISTIRRAGRPDGECLFERALGPDLALLPPAVRKVHTTAPMRLTGRATVEGAEHWLGRCLARLIGFPGSATEVAAEVVLTRCHGREIWTRRFGRARFRSTLAPGREPGSLVERFGPFAFTLLVAPHREGFDLHVAGWSLGPLRLPVSLAPKAPARACLDEMGRYFFDVSIGLPLLGRLVRYRGWLREDSPNQGSATCVSSGKHGACGPGRQVPAT